MVPPQRLARHAEPVLKLKAKALKVSTTINPELLAGVIVPNPAKPEPNRLK